MVRKLSAALEQARARLVEESREFSKAVRNVPARSPGRDEILLLEMPENRRRAAFEEYLRARRKLEEYLLAVGESIRAEEEEAEEEV